MAKSTGAKLETPRTRPAGYESLEDNLTDDEDTTTTHLDDRTRTSPFDSAARTDAQETNAVRYSDDGDDELLIGDGADIKLLPVQKRGELGINSSQLQPSFDTPSASRSSIRTDDVSDERPDVGKRVEQILEIERTALSESFLTDLEDGDSFALSDDDYESYPNKDLSKGKSDQSRNGSSRWRAIFSMRSWWHIVGLLVVGVLLMWLAARGLGLSISQPASAEYV